MMLLFYLTNKYLTFHFSVPGVRSAQLLQSLQPVRGDISDNWFETDRARYNEKDEDSSRNELPDVSRQETRKGTARNILNVSGWRFANLLKFCLIFNTISQI